MIQIGGTVEIGTPGHKRSFNTEKLKGQYEVTHKFTVKSLATDAGLASLAAAMGTRMSEHTKRRVIDQLDDPDGEERWLSWEKAGRLSRLVELRRVYTDLMAMKGKVEGVEEEAALLVDEAGVQEEQLLSGNVAPAKPEVGKEPSQVVSLFGGATGRQTTPQMPEQEEMK